MHGCFYNQALAVVRSTGAGPYCMTEKVKVDEYPNCKFLPLSCVTTTAPFWLVISSVSWPLMAKHGAPRSTYSETSAPLFQHFHAARHTSLYSKPTFLISPPIHFSLREFSACHELPKNQRDAYLGPDCPGTHTRVFGIRIIVYRHFF